MDLNGRTLFAAANGSLPLLIGARARGRSVRLPPLSFGFFVWPEANVKPCYTERQLLDEKHAKSFDLAGPLTKRSMSTATHSKPKAKVKPKRSGNRALLEGQL